MKFIRKFWINKIEESWKRRSIIWLSGVRRAGKTILCQSLNDVDYFDCELPRIRQMMEDPESFLKKQLGKRIVLDEVHRLQNPSELLKIAADHYPTIKIIATGSSTLGASAKFKDTLTGRKEKIWLTPMILEESSLFHNPNIEHRFLMGGLPPFFIQSQIPERDYQEWIDSYWAKDIQELFKLEKRHSFQKFVELILVQSGSLFEATRFAAPCEVNRSTISNYLATLEATHVATVIRPFNTHKPHEIISQPKVYGFDTGFVCYYRGWMNLRNEDFGLLFEHLVLNELQSQFQNQEIRYWRNKSDNEIDFIYLKSRNAKPITIECKWNSEHFEPSSLKSFRRLYPEGENFVVCNNIDRSFQRTYDNIAVSFVNISQLIDSLK